MMRVGLVILLILAMVSSLHICEFVVINKFCLLTSVSDTDRGGTTFSTVAPVKEIAHRPIIQVFTVADALPLILSTLSGK